GPGCCALLAGRDEDSRRSLQDPASGGPGCCALFAGRAAGVQGSRPVLPNAARGVCGRFRVLPGATTAACAPARPSLWPPRRPSRPSQLRTLPRPLRQRCRLEFHH
ncbi:unnamed protein product, partial [Symbiodinium pilosum]